MSSMFSINLAPCLIRLFVPREDSGINRAGNRKNFAPLFHRQSGRDERAAFFSSFYNNYAIGHAADDAVARRKIIRERLSSQGKFRDNRTVLKK